MEEVLWEIIARLETVAPHVWALAVRQAWIDVLQQCIFGVVGVAFVLKTWRRVKKELPQDIFFAVAAVVGCVACCALYNVISMILNPQWWAIQKIISLVP